MKKTILFSALLVTACGGETTDDGGDGLSPQCEADGYVAFDSANHLNQDIRLAVINDIVAFMDAARADATTANANFTAAKDLYFDLGNTANLREKVQGRVDEHVSGDPLQGDRLDATIVDWLNFGVAATTEAEASVAKQWVDKTFTEFFFLSVYHEMIDGSRPHWDEAYGYYGSGPDNAEATLAGFAATAFKRDGNNGTNLEAEIFNDLIDGSCELDTALGDDDSLDPSSVPELDTLISNVDSNMQLVLAYSVGHEAFGMQEKIDEGLTDVDGMWVKAAELVPFFIPLERIMNERGGDSAVRASEIRGYIDTWGIEDPSTLDLTSTTWMNDLATAAPAGSVPERIIELLEVEFGIAVQG